MVRDDSHEIYLKYFPNAKLIAQGMRKMHNSYGTAYEISAAIPYISLTTSNTQSEDNVKW